MANRLIVLNDARKEARSGLILKTRIILPPETGLHLCIGEKLLLKIVLFNGLEPGGGGGSRGNAHFKNITVRVRKSEFVKFLVGKDDTVVEDQEKYYRPIQGGQTLAEGQLRRIWVGFEAVKESTDELTPELIADVRATAEFDVGRYFTSFTGQSAYRDIHD
ncbi:MAG: hypothetical protein V3T80_11140 [Kiloniellales bacterium]